LFSDQKHFYLRFKVDIENDSEGPVVALDADSSQTNDTRVFRYVLGRERFIRKLREINHEVLKFACSKSYDEISGFWRINDIGMVY
jgi:hypothetical protein